MFKEFKEISNELRPMVRYWIPQAIPNEKDLRRDIQDFKKRGFGGVEIVPMLHLHDQEELDKKYWWGSERWLSNLECIMDEAEKQKMTVDLAISLQWPISLPGIHHPDDPSTLYELSYGFEPIKVQNGVIKLPQPRVSHKEGTKKLVVVSSYEYTKEHHLILDSYIDLSDSVQGDSVEYAFSDAKERIIFAFWEQPADQKINNHYYVIDHFSKESADRLFAYFEHTVLPIVQKYPNTFKSVFCDSLEYDVAQEWSRGFAKEFSDRRNYDLKQFLPAIDASETYPKNDSPAYVFDKKEVADTFNRDYCLTLSEMFNEYHLQRLTEKFEKHNIRLRYQVAYNKPLEIEAAAARVSIPENEALNRQSFDNLKSMSGAVHLANKSIYSYEANAEFGNAYGQTYEDINWWIKRGWMASMNQQVLHGAVYNGDMEAFCWPGYESMGKYVSNYWNRTLSSEGCKANMDFISRINWVARQPAKIDLVFLKNTFLNNGKGADGEHIVKDRMLLTNNGYTYDIASSNLLKTVPLKIENGYLNDEGGPGYKALFTEEQYVFEEDVELLRELAEKGLKIFIMASHTSQSARPHSHENIFYVQDYESLLAKMTALDIRPSLAYEEAVEIAHFHSRNEQGDYYILYNYNPVRLKKSGDKVKFDPATCFPDIDKKQLKRKSVNLLVPEGKQVIQMDPANGEVRQLVSQNNKVALTLEADEICIIGYLENPNTDIRPAEQPNCFKTEKIALDDVCMTMYDIIIPSGSQSFYDYSLEESQKDEQSYIPKKRYRFSFVCPEGAKEVQISFRVTCDICEIVLNGKTYYPLPGDNVAIKMKQGLSTGNNAVEINLFNTLKGLFSEDSEQLEITTDITIRTFE